MSEGELLRNQLAEVISEWWAQYNYNAAAPRAVANAAYDQAEALIERFDVRLRVPQEPRPNLERVEAMMRWLVDEGHMTPLAVRQLRAVLVAEVPDHPEAVLDSAGE